MEKEVLHFLKNQKPRLGVLATTSGNLSQCAVVAYCVLDDLSLLISTHKNSRKWKNIENNKFVSFTSGWDFKSPNVQYEGVAHLLDNGPQFFEAEKEYFTANPELTKFHTPDTVFIRISPRWIRITDFTAFPPKVVEKNV